MRLVDTTAESLLAFWAEAGVDSILTEDPIDRIAAGALVAVRPPPPKVISGPGTPASRTNEVSVQVGLAQSAAGACQTLTDLQKAVEAFEGCPLKFQSASPAIFTRGAPEAAILVVGDAPDPDDDLKGLPFSGKSGLFLDRMLASAGLSDRVLMTNSVFWHPPGGRNPTPEEQAVCLPFIERAIDLVRPRILLFLGAQSSKAMLKRNDGILQLRAKWLEWRSSDGEIGLPAIVIPGLAFLLKNPDAKKMAWIDLLTLAERLDRPAR